MPRYSDLCHAHLNATKFPSAHVLCTHARTAAVLLAGRESRPLHPMEFISGKRKKKEHSALLNGVMSKIGSEKQSKKGAKQKVE